MVVFGWCVWIPLVGVVVLVDVVGCLWVGVEAECVLAGVLSVVPLLGFLVAAGYAVVCCAYGWADPFVVDACLEPFVEVHGRVHLLSFFSFGMW